MTESENKQAPPPNQQEEPVIMKAALGTFTNAREIPVRKQ